jgi:4,5-dihydroxyphthalate decarboxylase
MPFSNNPTGIDMSLNSLTLSMAIGQYEHVRDIQDGTIVPEGLSLRSMTLPLEEIFHRFMMEGDFDISEMSMGRYVSLLSQGDQRITALPVFISRTFRHGMFYVRDGSPIRRLEDIQGKRVGVPEWAQTAGIYGRGLLSEQAGVDLASIEWVQSGVNEPGRQETVQLKLPQGLSYTSRSDKSLNQLLLDGDLDVVMSARPPVAAGKGLSRLLPDSRQLEEDYFRETGIFPVMHVLALKSEVLTQHPWVAMNLFKAFLQSKQRSLERMCDVTASYAPMAWLGDHTSRMKAVFGNDFFPYGVGSDAGGRINRTTLEAFLRFAFDQGVAHRQLEVDALFPANVLSSFKT